MKTVSPKNSIGDVFRKITARALGAQMRNVNFLEKEMTEFDSV
jgi:hypothetical protein